MQQRVEAGEFDQDGPRHPVQLVIAAPHAHDICCCRVRSGYQDVRLTLGQQVLPPGRTRLAAGEVSVLVLVRDPDGAQVQFQVGDGGFRPVPAVEPVVVVRVLDRVLRDEGASDDEVQRCQRVHGPIREPPRVPLQFEQQRVLGGYDLGSLGEPQHPAGQHGEVQALAPKVRIGELQGAQPPYRRADGVIGRVPRPGAERLEDHGVVHVVGGVRGSGRTGCPDEPVRGQEPGAGGALAVLAALQQVDGVRAGAGARREHHDRAAGPGEVPLGPLCRLDRRDPATGLELGDQQDAGDAPGPALLCRVQGDQLDEDRAAHRVQPRECPHEVLVARCRGVHHVRLGPAARVPQRHAHALTVRAAREGGHPHGVQVQMAVGRGGVVPAVDRAVVLGQGEPRVERP